MQSNFDSVGCGNKSEIELSIGNNKVFLSVLGAYDALLQWLDIFVYLVVHDIRPTAI